MQLRRMTMGALFHDVLHDLAHLDSRVWRTLIALVLKPGKLTNEFIAGRRTYYLPPFRLYLVLSLIFFLLPSFGGSNNVVIDTQDAQDKEAVSEAMRDLKKELGAGDAAQTNAGSDETTKPADIAKPATNYAQPGEASKSTPADGKPATLLQGIRCQTVHTDLFGGDSGWLQPRLVQACQHLTTVTQREFMRSLRNNIPKMMFIFLPLIALVNLILYVFRRRTYVEHLLFYVHYHAFAFLLLALQITACAILKWLHVPFLPGFLTFAAWAYLFLYLFKAMRSVYHQSKTMTALKYLVVLTAYGVCLLITFVGAAAYTAFTV